METLFNDALKQSGLVALLGAKAARLAAAARCFRWHFGKDEVRAALLKAGPWLFVAATADEEANAMGVFPSEGVAFPLQTTLQVDAVLSVPRHAVLVVAGTRGGSAIAQKGSMSFRGSSLCAWDTKTGGVAWEVDTSMKLLPPLVHLESIAAVCAGSFEGVFLWSLKDGSLLLQLSAQDPVDRIWHCPLNGLLLARTSEVLGLHSELLVWRVSDGWLTQPAQEDRKPQTSWSHRTLDMIVTLCCDRDVIFARVGVCIVAWKPEDGSERWRRKLDCLPRLPTAPTTLHHVAAHGLVVVATGNAVVALDAASSVVRYCASEKSDRRPKSAVATCSPPAITNAATGRSRAIVGVASCAELWRS
eukprot:TRINITY_DN58917_c0_g1_i2.p1 TRINITY_DN58917_c0_g1~~TRINITY_DN58917_c0_g1_i2.p1  ORF type:complete len:360 (+),score=60.34 TRINITY_DN58917_c0_g1_i2:186-1265(+)